MPPLPIALTLIVLLGAAVGALVNWATYTLAWNPRPISPWAAAHPQAPPRRWTDRLPVAGWFGLRRESEIHGPRFWVRPLLVEVAMATGLAWLYWWEVDQQRLVQLQVVQLIRAPFLAPPWTTVAMYASHVVLITLMAAASLIDLDEKIIPDEITVVGALLGLAIASAMPLALLPHVAERMAPAVASAEIAIPPGALRGQSLFVEPVTPTSPNPMPAALGGAPHWQGLAIGLGCLTLWCFALTPRIWRRRRGTFYGLRVLMTRVAREMRRSPLIWIWLGGTVLILGVWAIGGGAWTGLLTALIGMIGSGVMIWAVRIVGSAALSREAMGFGDVTLMMMIGAFLGWQAGVIVFFVSPFAGLVAGILQLVLRRDDMIPYGPFLCLGTLGVMLYWGNVWNRFQDLFSIWWLVPAVLLVCVAMLGGMLTAWRLVRR